MSLWVDCVGTTFDTDNCTKTDLQYGLQHLWRWRRQMELEGRMDPENCTSAKVNPDDWWHSNPFVKDAKVILGLDEAWHPAGG